MRPLLSLFLLLATSAAWAQDERRVVSPNGQVEFRIMVLRPQPGILPRLAYQILLRGKPLIDTSFLGLEILNQPLLGENAGMIASHTGAGADYHSLTAHYMQNGSTGRRINVEVRVYDEGVAFRYVVPKSNPLEDIRIENEATEFRLAGDADTYPTIHGEPHNHVPLSHIAEDALIGLPFVAEVSEVGWLAIAEAHAENYAPVHLVRLNGRTLLTRLMQRGGDPNVAVDTVTPLACAWRVVLVGASASQLVESKIAGGLPK